MNQLLKKVENIQRIEKSTYPVQNKVDETGWNLSDQIYQTYGI